MTWAPGSLPGDLIEKKSAEYTDSCLIAGRNGAAAVSDYRRIYQLQALGGRDQEVS